MELKELNFQRRGNIIKFEGIKKMQKLPFVIYADFETINKKIEGSEPNPDRAYTEKKTEHCISGFTFYSVSPYFKQKRETYRGPDAGEVFLKKILEEE